MDQSGNVLNACEALGVEVSSATTTASTPRSCEVWAFRVLRRVARTRKAMCKLMKLAACVGVFSHPAVNNDILKELAAYNPT